LDAAAGAIKDWPTLCVALSSSAAAGALFTRIDCASLVFPLLLPQGRHQSNQRERATTSVALFFFCFNGLL
jgi:hypothetical protein